MLILETTRGATETLAGFTREAELQRLITAIREGLQSGGVLVPVFALGRTQEMLAAIALAMEAGELNRQPVYIGGLGRVFTEIYDLVAARAPNQRPDLNLHEALDLQVLEQRDFRKLKVDGQLFVITAGMLSENTAAHHLAHRALGRERAASARRLGVEDLRRDGRAAQRPEADEAGAEGGPRFPRRPSA